MLSHMVYEICFNSNILYGLRKIYHQLLLNDGEVSYSTVSRLMRQLDIKSVFRGGLKKPLSQKLMCMIYLIS